MKSPLLLFTALFLSLFSSAQTTWYEVATPTTKKLNAIDFPTDQIGYIAGNDSTLLKSTDGGQTWSHVSFNGIQFNASSQDFLDVEFVDENTGFLVVEYFGVLKTVDGGTTWTHLTGQTSNMCTPTEAYAFTADQIFAGGAGCFEGVIIDEYVNSAWSNTAVNYQSWDTEEYVNDMDFIDANNGLAVLNSNLLVKTADGGQTWDTVSVNISGTGFLTSVLMVDNQLCYAGYNDNGSGFGLLKSEDGGSTWGWEMNMATFFYPAYLSICKAQNGDVYTGSQPSNSPGGLIFENESGNPGIWSYVSVDQPIHAMTSYGNDITFGAGDSGYVVVNIPPASVSLEEEEAVAFSVSPVPASTELIITGEALIEECRVYDLQGKELHVAMKDFNEGVRLDVAELASGTYLLYLLSDKRWVQFKFSK